MKMIIEQGTLKKCLLEPNETRLDVPDGVTRIGEGALWQIELEKHQQGWPLDFTPRCEALRELTLPEGLAEIGMGAFAGCVSLKCVRFPRSLRRIGDFAFSNCEALEEIELSEGLLKIGYGAFSYCALKKLSLPASLRRVGERAFRNCNLGYVRVPGPVKIAPNAFEGGTNRVELELGPLAELSRGLPCSENPRHLLRGDFSVPEGVTHIGEGAFRNLGYSSISLPEGLTSIAAHAFRACDELKEMVLPSTLRHIGDYAFEGCVKLRRLIVPEGLESVGSRAFADIGRPLIDQEVFDFAPEEQRSPACRPVLPEGVRFIDGYPFDPADRLDPALIRHGLANIAPYLHPRTLMKLFLYQPSAAARRKLEAALRGADFAAIAREITGELRRVRTRELSGRADGFFHSFREYCPPDMLSEHIRLMRELGCATKLEAEASGEKKEDAP